MRTVADRIPRNKLLHLILRLIVPINFAFFGLAEAYPPFFRFIGHGFSGKAVMVWGLSSCLLLPLYIAFEIRLMRNSTFERRALLLDVVLVTAWVLAVLGRVAYVSTHYAVI